MTTPHDELRAQAGQPDEEPELHEPVAASGVAQEDVSTASRLPAVAGRLVAVLRGDSLTRTASLLIGDYLLISAIGAACSVIAARAWSAHAVGTVASLVAVVGLIGTASSTGLASAITRFLGNESDQRGFVLEAMLVAVTLALALEAAVCFIPGHLGVPLHNLAVPSTVAFALLAAYSTGTMVVAVSDPAFISRTEVSFTVVKDITASLVRVVILLLLIGTGVVGLFGASAAYVSVAGVLDLGLVFWRLKRPPGACSITRLRTLRRRVRFVAGSHSAALVSAIPGTVAITVIAAHLGATDAAYAAIPAAVAMYITIIPSMTAQSVLAELRHEATEPAVTGLRGLRIAYAGTLPVAAAMLLLAHWIMLIYGTRYATHSTAILRWAALAGLVSVANYMSDTVLLGRQKLAAYNAANIFGSLGVIATMVGAVMVGFRWIGPAMLAGQVIYFVGSLAILLRYASVSELVAATRKLAWRL